MNLDEIEDLIRRYLSAGIAVVVILVVPATGGADEELAPGSEPSVVTIDPDRPDLDDVPLDPRDREVPDEDEPAEPEPARDGSPDEDPTDPDERRPADDTEEGEDPNRDEPADADPAPAHDDPDADDPDADDRENGPVVDQDDVRSDETDDSSTVDERPAGDDEPAGAEPAEDEHADEDTADPDTADPDTADARTDDPDLESRGPADGSEPGIDDEQAREPADDDEASAEDRDPDTRETTGSEPGSATEGITAAELYGWGTPDREDDFGSGLAQWELYDGPGHAGEGLRSPDAVTVRDGILTITGDAEGTTGGLTWTSGQRYGRWEGRVRAPASDPSYNALLLLWPDADDFPEGGEIDFMEMLDPTRQSTDFFLHHGPDNEQVTAQARVDGTQWHNWAVEWTPEEIVGYVDGEEWFRTTDTTTFPPGPMHLCIQLDWFPDGAGEVRESTMEVDWVRQYALEPGDEEPADDQPDREVASTEPASVGDPAAPDDNPLRRMFSWS